VLGAGWESPEAHGTPRGHNLPGAHRSPRSTPCDRDRARARRRTPRVRCNDWALGRVPSAHPMMPKGGSGVFCPVPEPVEVPGPAKRAEPVLCLGRSTGTNDFLGRSLGCGCLPGVPTRGLTLNRCVVQTRALLPAWETKSELAPPGSASCDRSHGRPHLFPSRE
jgi:hypothetical protein